MAELDTGLLLAIGLSDSEDAGEPHEAGAEAEAPRDKSAQSEEDFQAVRAHYVPKIENGEVCFAGPSPLLRGGGAADIDQIWKNVKLPLGDEVSKPAAEEVLHAVEELYFFRRYAEALEFMRRVLAAENLNGELAGKLRVYESKCIEKLGAGQVR